MILSLTLAGAAAVAAVLALIAGAATVLELLVRRDRRRLTRHR